MTSIAGNVPFGNLIDSINNAADDDFEDSFDETYGDPTNQPVDVSNLTWGFIFIGAICLLLLIITMIGYGWIWYATRMLKWCCPCCFRRQTAADGDPRDSQGGSSSNNNNNVPYDTSTAANSSNNSVDNDSDEEGQTELELQVVRNNSTYAKRLVRILTDEQKRSLFSSVLKSRTATEADIMEGKEEQQLHHPPVADCGCTCDSNENGNNDNDDENTGENSDENATTTTTASIVIPDGSPLPTATTANGNNNNNNNTACCPICIQDIEVGDRICHSKRKTCRHLFHLDCMLEWVGTGSTLCPVCRREIFTKAMLEKAYRDQQKQEQQQQKKKPKKNNPVCP